MDSVKKTFCRVIVIMLVICLLLTVTLASPAIADVTYTFTSDLFDTFQYSATRPPYFNITGFFTEPTALAANSSFDLTLSPPLSAQFTDGVHSFSGMPPYLGSPGFNFFSVATDAAGNIDSWRIQLWALDPVGYGFTDTMLARNDSYPEDYSSGPNYLVERVPGAGIWVTTGLPGSIPEPGTMLLLASGLVGLVGFRRKFKK